jgi:hypothetical protein
MYLAPLITTLAKAMRETFDADYPNPDFRKVNTTVEFPIAQQSYPAIWVDYTPGGEIEIAGIDHKEYVETEGTMREVHRWRFAGEATFTVATFSSFERFRLLDEVIRVIAFGDEQSATSKFREVIEGHEYIAMNGNFDSVGNSNFSVIQGTPWGGDEFIYEGTVTFALQGEFISDPTTHVLVPLSAIVVTPYTEEQGDPFDQVEGGQAGWA